MSCCGKTIKTISNIAEGKIKKALVIDLDAHQGNGTALCLANDPSTFTFSMHQGDIYPVPKAKSDLDVELPAGMKDEEFLNTGKRFSFHFTKFREINLFSTNNL